MKASQSFNITLPPNVTKTLFRSKSWFILRLLWTQSALVLLVLASTWSVTKIIIFSNVILMNPFPAVYHNTLGYDFQFSFWLTGYRCPCSTTGDINFINAQYWPSAVSLVLNGITETIVQCFLIYRYWRMSVIFVFITRSTIPSKICIGAKTIMSHLYWSYLCSQQCVNPTLGLQCVLILIMQSGGYIAASATLLQVPSTGNGHWVTLSALCVSFHYF